MLLELLAERPVSSESFFAGLTATEPTSTTTTATVAAETTAATATTVAGHFSETRINLLLGLLEDIDKITSLLLV